MCKVHTWQYTSLQGLRIHWRFSISPSSARGRGRERKRERETKRQTTLYQASTSSPTLNCTLRRHRTAPSFDDDVEAASCTRSFSVIFFAVCVWPLLLLLPIHSSPFSSIWVYLLHQLLLYSLLADVCGPCFWQCDSLYTCQSQRLPPLQSLHLLFCQLCSQGLRGSWVQKD